jgi:hypothetical protein
MAIIGPDAWEYGSGWTDPVIRELSLLAASINEAVRTTQKGKTVRLWIGDVVLDSAAPGGGICYSRQYSRRCVEETIRRCLAVGWLSATTDHGEGRCFLTLTPPGQSEHPLRDIAERARRVG